MKKEFAATILNWYASNKRALPWRSNPTPYHVLISEIMLQQTQVPRVIEKFKEFITLFPTLQHLAHASKAEVIHAWSGLGYNRRALLLHQFAKVVVAKHQGIIPKTVAELQHLPGIGPYTTGAILSFAYNLPAPAVDVNVRRMYQRYFNGLDQGLPMGVAEEKKLYALVKSTIPDHKSREFHNALMDFGSLLCTRDTPRCGNCPLQQSCKFFPRFRKNKTNALFQSEKRKESGVKENGRFIPNRIFRGKIVEFVRRNDGKTVALPVLGKAIKQDYSSPERTWLLQLCTKLQHEGLITFSCQGSSIRLFLAKD
ncbi:A/G-specific adenine glycosylase [Candidatus Woesearchaeota archaeon]|nr:A/G-specific adenine glycosylase [Candidatus Woesearchaeota archaeon]